MTFDSVVQSDSSPPINERCQIKSKLLHLIAELTSVWPATGWSGGSEEAALRNACDGFDTTSDGLRTFRDLNIDQVQFALDTLRSHVEELERLLTNAHVASGTRAHGRSSGYRGPVSDEDRLLDEALAYFGYSRTPRPQYEEMHKKWRARHRDLHKQSPPDIGDEQKRLNMYHDCIRDWLNGRLKGAAA